MKTEERRSLNSLEELFAVCNVRFALLVDLGDVASMNTTSPLSIDEVMKRTTGTCRTCPLGHMAIEHTVDEGWSLVLSDRAVATVVLRNHAGVVKDCGSFLDAIVQKETLPADGPISVQLIPYHNSSKKNINDNNMNPVHQAGDKNGHDDDEKRLLSDFNDRQIRLMLYVNGNHAICDGRSLTHFVTTATKTTETTTPAPTRDDSETALSFNNLPQTLSDWKELVKEALLLQLGDGWNLLPPFSLGTTSQSEVAVLSMKELCSSHTTTATTASSSSSSSTRKSFVVEGTRSLRYEISHNAVMSMLLAIKEKTNGKASMTGLLAATIMHSIAKEYYDIYNNKDNHGQHGETPPQEGHCGLNISGPAPIFAVTVSGRSNRSRNDSKSSPWHGSFDRLHR
jgi:hypothetical protein